MPDAKGERGQLTPISFQNKLVVSLMIFDRRVHGSRGFVLLLLFLLVTYLDERTGRSVLFKQQPTFH